MTPPPRRYDQVAPRMPEGPIDLTALVPGDGPIELDIGFGRGRSLLTRARAEPSRRIIGLELKAKWAFLVEERRIREGLANARAYRGDARELLPTCGPQGCLQTVFLSFPDPWWKKRHARRRVLDADLVVELARLMAPGALWLIQTDVEERAALYEERVRAHEAFEVERIDRNPFGLLSNREARAEQDGLPVYRLLARRS